MTKEEALAIWAPEASIWSPWVKPVLFSYLDHRRPSTSPLPRFDLSWAPGASNTAFVVDIPGVEAVAFGVQVAAIGYRPIPLFNSIPLPADSPTLDEIGRAVAAVDSALMLAPLHDGAKDLSKIVFPENAPPAFLLDANRGGPVIDEPDYFDNRSVSFTTDFPSAKFLSAHAVTRAILVTKNSLQPQTDLAHTLRRWQEAGISILAKRLDSNVPPEPTTVERPPRFRAMFQRALAAFGLKMAPSGGYGAWLPEGHGGGG